MRPSPASALDQGCTELARSLSWSRRGCTWAARGALRRLQRFRLMGPSSGVELWLPEGRCSLCSFASANFRSSTVALCHPSAECLRRGLGRRSSGVCVRRPRLRCQCLGPLRQRQRLRTRRFAALHLMASQLPKRAGSLCLQKGALFRELGAGTRGR